MSNGDNKPGLRDIRSLRERLGMLNKGNGQGESPSAPTGPAPSNQEGPSSPITDLVNNPDALAGSDTAVINVGVGESEQTEEVTQSVNTSTNPPSPGRPSSPQGPRISWPSPLKSVQTPLENVSTPWSTKCIRAKRMASSTGASDPPARNCGATSLISSRKPESRLPLDAYESKR